MTRGSVFVRGGGTISAPASSFFERSQPRASANAVVKSPTTPARICESPDSLFYSMNSRICTEMKSSKGLEVSVKGCHCQYETSGQFLIIGP